MSARIVARLAVEPAHDAEIDDRDRAVGVDEHIAGMQIGVKEAVAEHLVEERARPPCCSSAIDIVPGGEQRRAVVDPDAGDALGGQHRAPGAPPIDPRHAKARVAGEILGELGGGRRLEAQIHLELRPIAPGSRTTSTGFSRRSAGRVRSIEPRQPAEQVEVAGKGARRSPAAAP